MAEAFTENEAYKTTQNCSNLKRFLQAALSSDIPDGIQLNNTLLQQFQEVSNAMGEPDRYQMPQFFRDCTDGKIEAVETELKNGQDSNEIGSKGETALICATRTNNCMLVKLLLDYKANPNLIPENSETSALIDAASFGNVELVELLLKYGADPDLKMSLNKWALHAAAAAGHYEICVMLLDKSKNKMELIERQNENGHTALMEAVTSGSLPLTKYLVDLGAQINTPSVEFKETALTLASYKGFTDIVKFLLESGADHEHKTDEMHTALMEAAMEGHIESARVLLDYGAQTNIRMDSFETSLTLASCSGHTDLDALLLKYGADIEEINDELYTPLMEASREGHLQTVLLLIAAGAKINRVTEETQETAMTLAACGGFYDVVMALHRLGADIELGASTPLMEAAQEGHVEIVKALLSLGANLEAHNATEETSIHFAAENGHLDICDLLLVHGTVIDKVSEDGRTPLMKACRAGNLDVVQLLIKKGAVVDRLSTQGDHTPLSLACANGHVKVVEYLLQVGADPTIKLKDNCSVLTEASRAGHSEVMKLLLGQQQQQQMILQQKCELGSSQFSLDNCIKAVPQNNNLLGTHQSSPIYSRVPSELCNSSGNQISCVTDDSVNSSLFSQNSENQSVLTVNSHITPPPPPPPPPISDFGFNHSIDELEPSPSFSMLGLDQKTFQTMIDSNSNNIEELVKCFYPNLNPIVCQNNSTSVNSVPCNTISTNTPIVDIGLINNGLPEPTLISQHQQSFTNTCPPNRIIKKARHSEIYNNSNVITCSNSTGSLNTNVIVDNSANKICSFNCPSSLTPFSVQDHQSASLILDYNRVSGDSSDNQYSQFHKSAFLSNQSNKYSEDLSSSTINYNLVAKNASKSQNNLLTTQKNIFSNTPQRPFPNVIPQLNDSSVFSIDKNFMRSNNTSYSDEDKGSSEPKRIAINNSSTMVTAVSSMSMTTSNFTTSNISSISTTDNVLSTTMKLKNTNSQPPFNKQVLQPKRRLQQSIKSSNFITNSPVLNSSSSSISTGFTSSIDYSSKLVNDFKPLSQTDSFSAAQTPVSQNLFGNTSFPGTDFGYNFNFGDKNQLKLEAAMNGNMSHLNNKVSSSICQLNKFEDSTNLIPPNATTNMLNPNSLNYSIECMPKVNNEDMSIQKDKRTILDSLGAVKETENEENDECKSDCEECEKSRSRGRKQQKLNVNVCTESMQESPLSLACKGGHVDVARLLINSGAKLEHRDKKSQTPLHVAVLNEHLDVVKLLLDMGAEIEALVERSKDSALGLASANGFTAIVCELITRGASLEHRNLSDYTPLCVAASGGHLDVVRELLKAGAEINARTNSRLGISPLMLAAMNGHLGVVRELLERGSDINAQIETNRNSALTLSCCQGRTEVVQLLVSRNVALEHRPKSGLTPLMEAAVQGHVDVGRVLLTAGADPNAAPVMPTRDTALIMAAEKGHTEFVHLLLVNRAAVDARNKKGDTALWLACSNGALDVVKHLINYGADANSADNRRVTCLMAAFNRGHVKVVRELVKRVTQFPSEIDCNKHIKSIRHQEELARKCDACKEIVLKAKERQEHQAAKNAKALLIEVEEERKMKEQKEVKLAKKREKKKAKKKAKQEEKDVDVVKPEPKVSITDSHSSKELCEEIKLNKLTDSIETNITNNENRNPIQQEQEVDCKENEDSNIRDQHQLQQKKIKENVDEEKIDKKINGLITKQKKEKPSVSTNQCNNNNNSVNSSTGNSTFYTVSNNSTWESSNKNRGNSWIHISSSKAGKLDDNQILTSGNLNITSSTSSTSSTWQKIVVSKRKIDIPVNKKDIGKVIGQGGAVVNTIRHITGAHIDIDSTANVMDERIVHLKGTSEAVLRAKEMICDLVEGKITGIDVVHDPNSNGGSAGITSTSSVGGLNNISKPVSNDFSITCSNNNNSNNGILLHGTVSGNAFTMAGFDTSNNSNITKPLPIVRHGAPGKLFTGNCSTSCLNTPQYGFSKPLSKPGPDFATVAAAGVVTSIPMPNNSGGIVIRSNLKQQQHNAHQLETNNGINKLPLLSNQFPSLSEANSNQHSGTSIIHTHMKEKLSNTSNTASITSTVIKEPLEINTNPTVLHGSSKASSIHQTSKLPTSSPNNPIPPSSSTSGSGGGSKPFPLAPGSERSMHQRTYNSTPEHSPQQLMENNGNNNRADNSCDSAIGSNNSDKDEMTDFPMSLRSEMFDSVSGTVATTLSKPLSGVDCVTSTSSIPMNNDSNGGIFYPKLHVLNPQAQIFSPTSSSFGSGFYTSHQPRMDELYFDASPFKQHQSQQIIPPRPLLNQHPHQQQTQQSDSLVLGKTTLLDMSSSQGKSASALYQSTSGIPGMYHSSAPPNMHSNGYLPTQPMAQHLLPNLNQTPPSAPVTTSNGTIGCNNNFLNTNANASEERTIRVQDHINDALNLLVNNGVDRAMAEAGFSSFMQSTHLDLNSYLTSSEFQMIINSFFPNATLPPLHPTANPNDSGTSQYFPPRTMQNNHNAFPNQRMTNTTINSTITSSVSNQRWGALSPSNNLCAAPPRWTTPPLSLTGSINTPSIWAAAATPNHSQHPLPQHRHPMMQHSSHLPFSQYPNISLGAQAAFNSIPSTTTSTNNNISSSCVSTITELDKSSRPTQSSITNSSVSLNSTSSSMPTNRTSSSAINDTVTNNNKSES